MGASDWHCSNSRCHILCASSGRGGRALRSIRLFFSLYYIRRKFMIAIIGGALLNGAVGQTMHNDASSFWRVHYFFSSSIHEYIYESRCRTCLLSLYCIYGVWCMGSDRMCGVNRMQLETLMAVNRASRDLL